MGVINVGSINVDHFYDLPHFAAPGETLASLAYRLDLGGKGMNQSVALLRAGTEVIHVGAIGADDTWLAGQIQQLALAEAHIARLPMASGHAIIQVDAQGENCIILHPGCNHAIDDAQIQKALDTHPNHRWVLLQNETNATLRAAELAAAEGRYVVYNPAPMKAELAQAVLPHCRYLVVNQVELQQLTQIDDVNTALQQLLAAHADLCIVLTLGGDGVLYQDALQAIRIQGQVVDTVDTTAAGDTFIGYFLAALDEGMGTEEALILANRAAALCVTRRGTSSTIPWRREVQASS